MHRGAAEMDGWFRASAGVFSSDPARSRAAGAALGFDPARSYGDVAEMLAQERARPDRIDAVAIMTPNDTHYPYAAAALDAGLDVVCDKPVTHDFREACDLVARTRAHGRIFAIAHGYAAYPMTRYARQLVRDGALGTVRLVQVEYIQSGLAARIEDGPQNNRLRVYGEKGMLDWSHREPSYLKLALQGEPARTIGRGDPFLPPEIIATGRTPRGHPEGLREAFANIYAEVAQERMARELGETVPDLPYPRIEEGAHTMAFIEACVASQARGSWVDVARAPLL
jgi:predicted dehydrogenase